MFEMCVWGVFRCVVLGFLVVSFVAFFVFVFVVAVVGLRVAHPTRRVPGLRVARAAFPSICWLGCVVGNAGVRGLNS